MILAGIAVLGAAYWPMPLEAFASLDRKTIPLQVLNEPLRHDLGHELIGVVDTLCGPHGWSYRPAHLPPAS